MRTLLILLLMATTAQAAMVEEYKDGILVSSYDTANTDGVITKTAGHDIYVDGVQIPVWNPDAFLTACTGFFDVDTKQHVWALTRAVDRNTPEAWAWLAWYAQQEELTVLAEQIIGIALANGANVGEIE